MPSRPVVTGGELKLVSVPFFAAAALAAAYVRFGEQGNADSHVVEQKTPATYRIEKTGAEKDKRKVTVSWAGQTSTFPARSFSTSKDCSM